MKLKTNWNFSKGSRTKISNQMNKDQSWNLNKEEDNSEILNSQHEFWGEERARKRITNWDWNIKLKTNWNFSKESRTKINNQRNKDQSWNLNKKKRQLWNFKFSGWILRGGERKKKKERKHCWWQTASPPLTHTTLTGRRRYEDSNDVMKRNL
jgi:hypothetical protein